MGKEEKLNDKKMNLEVICSIVYNVKCLVVKLNEKSYVFPL